METGLLATAIFIAITHTLAGPDHYLPFVAMAKARGWSHRKTATITALCGVGHATGSIILGLLGVAFGAGLMEFSGVETMRGDWAAWALIAFGTLYAAWGLKRAIRNRSHSHAHVHADGSIHRHPHNHHGGHVHVHEAPAGQDGMVALATPWSLFIIFILGPCEPMIPLMMVPVAAGAFGLAGAVALTYTAVTIFTMLAVVFAGLYGLTFVPGGQFRRFGHAAAGTSVAMCGAAMAFLGL